MEVGNSEKPAKQGYSLSQISLVAALVEGIIVFLQGDWPFYPALFVCFYRNLHHNRPCHEYFTGGRARVMARDMGPI